jgi:hypothetical protein
VKRKLQNSNFKIQRNFKLQIPRRALKCVQGLGYLLLCVALCSCVSQKVIRLDNFNVRAFGARGDGKTLDSPAIDRAIRACAAAGGGTVFVPAGTYLSGSIHLTNNLNLYLDAGATILAAPQKLQAYDATETWKGTAYQDGGHTYFRIRLSFEKADLRPAVVCEDVDGLEISNFKAQVADGVSAARYKDVKGLVVRDSPGLKEQGVQ